MEREPAFCGLRSGVELEIATTMRGGAAHWDGGAARAVGQEFAELKAGKVYRRRRNRAL